MGRKIPAKKHRGVKDPLQQQAKRLQSLKGKINAPPADPDEQPVPRSLTRLFNLAPKHKALSKPKPHHTELISKPSGVSLRRAAGESTRAFSQRISATVRQIKDDTDYHDIQAEERRDLRGERIAELREKRRRKKQKGRQEERERETDELSRKARRRKEQQEKKKAKEADKLQSSSEIRYERVSFGERVDAPPSLPPPRVRPHKGDTEGLKTLTQGPCGRRGLLLEAMLR